jgi:hypothetical protein
MSDTSVARESMAAELGEARRFAQVCLAVAFGAETSVGKVLDDGVVSCRYVFAVECASGYPAAVVVAGIGYWRCWELMRPGAPPNELYPQESSSQ